MSKHTAPRRRATTGRRLSLRARCALLDALYVTDPTSAWAALTQNERDVLIVFAVHAGRNCRAWPSHETIAREAKCSPASVYRAIEGLVAAGWLEIIEHRHRNSTILSIAPLIRRLSTDETIPPASHAAFRYVLQDPAFFDSHSDKQERPRRASVDSHRENRAGHFDSHDGRFDSHSDEPRTSSKSSSKTSQNTEGNHSRPAAARDLFGADAAPADAPKVLNFDGTPHELPIDAADPACLGNAAL